MTEQLNIIYVFCDVSLDSADHSTKTDNEQKVCRNHIHHLFDIAYGYIGQTNRIILINANGAEIAYAGPPEDAMLMAKDMLSGILIANKQGSVPLSIRIGIHLQPVNLLEDFNDQTNIISSGIDVAKKRMSQAKPNEILVSPSYYENIPVSMQSHSQLFSTPDELFESHELDDGISLANLNDDINPEDKNVGIQPSEIYSSAIEPSVIQPSVIHSTMSVQPFPQTDTQQISKKSKFSFIYRWKYSLGSLSMIFALILTIKLADKPLVSLPLKHPAKQINQPANVNTHSAEQEIPAKLSTEDNATAVKSEQLNQDQLNQNQSNQDQLNQDQLNPEKINPQQSNLELSNSEQLASEKPASPKPNLVKKDVEQKTKNKVDTTTKKSNAKELLNWETFKKSFKQGKKNECTQSEIALNQCR